MSYSHLKKGEIGRNSTSYLRYNERVSFEHVKNIRDYIKDMEAGKVSEIKGIYKQFNQAVGTWISNRNLYEIASGRQPTKLAKLIVEREVNGVLEIKVMEENQGLLEIIEALENLAA